MSPGRPQGHTYYCHIGCRGDGLLKQYCSDLQLDCINRDVVLIAYVVSVLKTNNESIIFMMTQHYEECFLFKVCQIFLVLLQQKKNKTIILQDTFVSLPPENNNIVHSRSCCRLCDVWR